MEYLTKRNIEPITVQLKFYHKTELEKALDKVFGNECGYNIYKDVERTYNESISKYAQREIKIKTDLLEQQVYKFGMDEVEIIN